MFQTVTIFQPYYSQGIVAMLLRCSWIFRNNFIAKQKWDIPESNTDSWWMSPVAVRCHD